MKKEIIPADYDGEKQELTLLILENKDSFIEGFITKSSETFVNIVDSSILKGNIFYVDGDIFSINPNDLYQFLDINKSYILIEHNNKMIVMEYGEEGLLDTLYYLNYYACFADERNNSLKSSSKASILVSNPFKSYI